MLYYNQDARDAMRREAFDAGQQAAINGDPSQDNPHHFYSDAVRHQAWREGWKSKALPSLPRVQENGFNEEGRR